MRAAALALKGLTVLFDTEYLRGALKITPADNIWVQAQIDIRKRGPAEREGGREGGVTCTHAACTQRRDASASVTSATHCR